MYLSAWITGAVPVSDDEVTLFMKNYFVLGPPLEKILDPRLIDIVILY